MAINFHLLANPTRLLKWVARLSPWIGGLCFLFLCMGAYFALFASPADYQQGDSVRIMYIHVPAAWMALFIYVVMAVLSAMSLIWKHPLADVSGQAAAPIGMVFCLLALITGSIWGKPMWGTWWVWDARLTSFLILFFLYIGYMALQDAFEQVERGYKAAAILSLVGVVNIPVIKFSVDWWNTLHQPASVGRLDGPTIAPEMLVPLFLMAIAFKLFFVYIWGLRVRSLFLHRKLENILQQSIADPTHQGGT